jgi:hypothetical protein
MVTDHDGTHRRLAVVSVDWRIEDPVGMEGLGRGSWSSHGDSGAEGARFKLDEILGSESEVAGADDL